MTYEEILAMRAGPALDEAVAAHVFGWTRESDGYWRTENPNGTGNWYTPGEVPPFSASIAAAWLVVERLGEDDLSVVIATNGCAPRQNGAKVFPGVRGLGSDMFDASRHNGWHCVSETVPAAICKAALMATVTPAPEAPHGE